MRTLMTMKTLTRLSVVCAAVMLLSGCGNKHYLAEYEFSEKTLALVYIEPPAPELLHGWLHVDADDNPIQAVVRAGAGVAKEVEARRAKTRLDSAAMMVDVSTRLAERTLERAARYLGTTPVDRSAGPDYILVEHHERSFGLDALSYP